METRAITARYLTKFRCLGSSCEDTCCQGWRVPVDARQYQILRTAMDRSPAERAEIGAAVEEPGPGGDEGRVRLRAVGLFSFLTGARLCSVQERYGASALPAVCASYPRIIAQAGSQREIWGALSCPEMARL